MKAKIKRLWRNPLFYGLLYVLIIIGIAILKWKWIKYIIQFLQVIAFSWVISGMFRYWYERGSRKKQKQYQAWQAINLAQRKPGSGGRIQALEELCKDEVSLNGIDVSKAYLREIHLQKAKLQGANFKKADLSDADLRGADFQRADLILANLSGVKLQKSDLSDADLRGADLHKSYFNESKICGADLREADLSDADLREANLMVANLQGANLQRAKLQRAQLVCAKLLEANLMEADLMGAKNITIKQLSEVKTLYQAKLDPEIAEQIKKHYPHLFEMPLSEEII